MAIPITNTINGYEVVGELGVGGFGKVYQAQQTSIQRQVAIKIIKSDFANRQDFIRRFEAEAHVIARLEHPHIVPLYDYWRDPTGAYLVMRYLRSGSLRQLLDRQIIITPIDTANMLDQIASGLDHAHRNNVVHRDIKPGNILLDEDGNAYVADFGIAKDLTLSDSGMTDADGIVGSLDYLSPEQARSEQVTARTDIYSLGVTVYEMLVGRHPFHESSSVERLYKHINDPLPEIVTIDASIRIAVNDVIQIATQKDPVHRYQTVLEFAHAFREAVNATDSLAMQLTSREYEVLLRIVDGLSNKEIADDLFITLGTVKNYVKSIYKKLGVRSRVQVTIRAHELNLLNLGVGQGIPTLTGTSYLPEPQNPYKGLRPFDAADSLDFFGRETLVHKLLSRMIDHDEMSRFLAIVGPSGSGKSSLVRAGLIPAIWNGYIVGSDRWYTLNIIPGIHPMEELEIALTRISSKPINNLDDHLWRDNRGLLRASKLILPDDDTELMIVIDQFEEVFTLVEDEKERQQLLDIIYSAATDTRSRVRIIITIRADFYDKPLMYPDFGELMRNRMETILPLSAKELERAIVGPAERQHLVFEEGLVAHIISEINYHAGALPLLQYALTELFEHREGLLLTQKAYQEIGGAVGALAERAEKLYSELDEQHQQITQQMFMRLVTLGEGAGDTRRRANHAELLSIVDTPDLMDDVIDLFTANRLLLLDHDLVTRQPTVEVAHEAILTQWQRLRGWISASRENIKMQQRLSRLAEEWRHSDRDGSFLLVGSRLKQFEQWLAENRVSLTPYEKSYIEESIRERDLREQQETRRQRREAETQQQLAEKQEQASHRLRLLVYALLVFLAGALILSLVAFSERNQAEIARESESNARALAEDSLRRTNAQRLALESISLQQTNGDPELVAMLAIQSLNTEYTPQGDRAIQSASMMTYPLEKLYLNQPQVVMMDMTPDEQWLAVGMDSSVEIWDMNTRQMMHQLDGSHLVMFLPNGERLVSADRQGTVRVWDVQTGEMITEVNELEGYALAMEVIPERNLLALSGNGNVLLLDTDTWQIVEEFEAHDNVIEGLAASADGQWLFTGSADHMIHRWNMDTLEIESSYQMGEFWVNNIALSPDGQTFASSSPAGAIWIWHIDEELPVYVLLEHTDAVLDLQFSADGSTLISASSDATVRFWNVTYGREPRPFVVHPDMVSAVQWFDNDTRIISASRDGVLRIWDAINPSLQISIPNGTHRNQHAFSLDGHYLAAIQSAELGIFDTETGEMVAHHKQEGVDIINAITYTPDGDSLIFGTGKGEAVVLNFNTMEISRTFTGLEVVTPDIALSPDERYLAGGDFANKFVVWDYQSGDSVFSQRFNSPVAALAFSPDGQYLLQTTQMSGANLWDTSTWESVWQQQLPGGWNDILFTPDGKYFAIGTEDGVMRLYDAETQKLVREYIGHRGAVTFIDVSEDSTLLLSGSRDGSARLWELETGKELRRIESGPINHVLISPDSHMMLIGDSTKATLWQTDIQDSVNTLCQYITRDFSDGELQYYEIEQDIVCKPYES